MVDKVAKWFLQALDEKKDLNTLQKIILMANKSELNGWTDENGLDLLHYCILSDNVEASYFLLRHGYFSRPFQPAVSPYLHLAALFGYKTILTVLLQHRPDDFNVASCPLFVPQRMVHRLFSRSSIISKKGHSSAGRSMSNESPQASLTLYKKASEASNSDDSSGVLPCSKKRHSILEGLHLDGSKPLMKNPLEVAAHAKRLQCVRVLLDMCVLKVHPDVISKGYFTLATLADCPPAIQLLFMLEAEEQLRRSKGVKFAVGRSAYSSALHCLLETMETNACHLPKAAVIDIVDEWTCTLINHKANPAKLFELLADESVVDVQHKYQDDVNTVLTLFCRFMTPSAIREAAFFFRRAYGRTACAQVKYYSVPVQKDLDERCRHVWSLRNIAAWMVWRLCGRQAETVRQLNLKVDIKTLILPNA